MEEEEPQDCSDVCPSLEQVPKTSENNFEIICNNESCHSEASNCSEGKGMSSSGGDGNDEEVSNKKMKAKRGRKASVKDKPPAPDNGLSSKSYLPEDTEQTYRTHRCPKCQRCFKMRSHLREHLHLHFPDPGLQCPSCKRHFTSKSKLRVHQLREAGVKVHRCHLCQYSSVERNSLRRHLVSVHADETEESADLSYPCPTCGESFRQSKSLKAHMKTHNILQDTKPLSCIEEGCSFESPLRRDLLQHVAEVHGFTAVQCRHHACAAIFQSQTQMEAHFRTHLAYHCPDCDFSCSNKRLFVQHRRQGHSGSERLSCEFCHFVTFNPVAFEQHVGHLHANEKIHRCSQCDYVTAHKRGLKRHMLTHSGEKPHKCTLCDFRCRDESYLSRHMVTHSDDKNFMCSECGYVTKWKHYLIVHMRKHAGDLRYDCDQCSYRCHRMDQLSSHKLRHQDKSLICEVCAYACKRKYELRNHMLSKHSADRNKPASVYKCKYCAYTTSYRQALQNHENCKHTKLKEFPCALCSYSSFSGVSLFLHKRKTHGYVPGDKEWLHNYALKEKERSTMGILEDFYKKPTAEGPIAAPGKQCDSSDVSKKVLDSINVLDVVSQEDVLNSLSTENSPEEYCTLVLTALTSTEYQHTTENSTALALHCNSSPKNRGLSSCSGLSEEEETALGSEQICLDEENQIDESPEIENAVEVSGSTLQAEVCVNDLKQYDKDQAEAMVLDGRVEVLMVPARDVNGKVRSKNSQKTLSAARRKECQECGARFKQQRGLDVHLKKKCKRTEFDLSPATKDKLIVQEEVESSSMTENRAVDHDFNLQEEPESPSDAFNSSNNSCQSRENRTSQPPEAKKYTSTSVSSHKECFYTKNGDKYECRQCGFSSARLVTVERHIWTCTNRSNETENQKVWEREDTEETEERRVLKKREPKSKAVHCSERSFIAKSKHTVGLQKEKPTRLACEYCAFSCKEERRMVQHAALKHDGAKPHKCGFCSFSTTRRYRLEEHQSLHTGLGRHECDTCGKTFGASSKLRQHKLRLHDKEAAHFCSQCDFRGFTQDDVKRHRLRCHSGDLRHDCERCEARFSSESALRSHCKRKHQVGFSCKECDFTCSSDVELKKHQKSKHKLVLQESSRTNDLQKSPLNCQLCSFPAKTKKVLAQHLLAQHEEGLSEEDKPLRCSLCEFTCRHQPVLEQHLRSHGGKRLYKCTQCEYSTRNKQKMTWHVRIHTGEKPYSCELCAYTCTDPSRLKLHTRVHQEEKKYLCPECGYKCKWATQLKYHMTKHTGEKRYACEECEYRTNRADALRSHRDTQHCDRRPFICEKCGKAFKTSFILKSHQQQHRDGRPYSCGLCQKSFRWPAGLRHHYLSHTKQQPFSCRHCSYRAKQKFQVVKHLQRHHPEASVEEGVERDAEAGTLTLKEALEGTLDEKTPESKEKCISVPSPFFCL